MLTSGAGFFVFVKRQISELITPIFCYWPSDLKIRWDFVKFFADEQNWDVAEPRAKRGAKRKGYDFFIQKNE